MNKLCGSDNPGFLIDLSYFSRLMRNVDMSTLMLPAATMTTMTNTAPIAVAQPKADPVKGTLLNNNNNKQGRTTNNIVKYVSHICVLLFLQDVPKKTVPNFKQEKS